MTIQLIRNATVKINYGGKTWLTDPFLAAPGSLPSFAGKSLNPTTPLPMSVTALLKDVDYILLTHLHPDHFDLKAQEILPRDIPIFVQPSDAPALEKMGFHDNRVIEQTLTIGNTVIHRVPAWHGEGDILQVMGAVSGYVLKATGEPTLYITGDTIWCEPVKDTLDQYEPAVVVCNAGGNVFSPENNPFNEYLSLQRAHTVIMNEEQVGKMLRYRKELTVITVHIGALDHETVTRDSMKGYLESQGFNRAHVYIPQNGETIDITYTNTKPPDPLS